MAYRPLGNNVLVERIEASKETASGIILKSTQEPDRAKIISIGSEVTEVAVDEIAVVNWNRASKVDGELYILPITEIVLVIED